MLPLHDLVKAIQADREREIRERLRFPIALRPARPRRAWSVSLKVPFRRRILDLLGQPS